MNSKTIIEPLNHTHRMIVAGRIELCDKVIIIQQCYDLTCGYWEDHITQHTDSTKCEMMITKFSTRAFCYNCKHCGRSEIDSL